jgi:CRISPR-associated protein Cmr6
MVYQKPNRPQPPQANRSPVVQRNPTQRSDRSNQNSGGDRGGNNNNRAGSGNGGSGGSNNPPSPWLDHPLHGERNSPNLDPTASFVEYLRWMRSPDSDCKDPTKVQLLQMAEERANYRDRLIQLTDRTKQIAGEGNFFQVKCSWRIRVGGHRGPESILLPAFDALGMPYIPSRTPIQ